ncbi:DETOXIFICATION 53 [Olea europaea subsp. europaea]|uniref:Protein DETOXIFICATION n=1 Tax=Olea europaea subsp. europaea TaxID=158383 RepID=A0A8S0R5W9_OLEEU|nr:DETOXIFICATION 53 [Olea europaea subsp. europaea]
MSESRELELHTIDGAGDDIITTAVDNDSNEETRNESAEDKPFQQFFRMVPANQVVEELFQLGKIACPMALTTMLYYSKTIISMLFLGHMEKPELAGGSLAVGFANITGYSVMKGLCTGMDPICCQAFGARRWSILSQTYIKTVLLLLLASIPVAVLWLNGELVFQRLGQDRVISKIAKNYLIFNLPELLAHAFLVPLRTFLRTQGLNSPNTMVATCVSILHLPITYFLVTYMNLRVKGLAMASVIYSINNNMGLFIYLFFSKVAIKPWAGATLGSIFRGWGPLLGLALPSVVQVCLEWWWYEIILFLSGLLNNPESCVAAMGVLIQTTGTIYVLSFAISLSISQRVGHALGAGEHARAQLATIIGIFLGLCYGISAFGLSIALKNSWGKLYTSDPQVLALISAALPILGLAEIGNAPQTAACGALTGSARPKIGIRINLAAFYLVGLPSSALFAFKLKIGFQGLWLGLVAAQVSCLIMMLFTLAQTDWKHQAKRAEELTMVAEEKDEDTVTNLVP